MGSRSRGLLLVGALLLTLALPAQAQDGTSRVRLDDVGFSFDHSLGGSVNILRVPRQRQRDALLGEATPAHILFTLYPRQGEDAPIPAPWDVPGAVRFYRTGWLEGHPRASQQLQRLQRVLAERPDPSSLEAVTQDGVAEVPYLPVVEEAAQLLVARAQYIETPEVTGVAYVTGFGQDTFPFTRDGLWYTFQGVSTNGRWYVAVSWSLRADMLPTRISQADAERVGRNGRTWARYVRQTVATLDAAEPTAFTPSLDTLDALVRSIDFDSVVQPTASPALVPTPSGPVVPSEAPTGSISSTTP